MSNALIVGYGFTGSSIDRALSNRGFTVYGLRRDWSSESKTTRFARPVTGDITEPRSLEHLEADFEVVVNCVSAGERGNPDRYRKIYVEGAKNLIHWAKNCDVSTLIYTGSSTVYGDRDGTWVDETSKPAADTTSAEILLEAEELYRQAHRSGDLSTVICRLTGIYGTGRQRVLDRYFSGNITLRDNGRRFRNMVRREDVGEMIGQLAAGSPDHHCYNLTDNKPVQEREFFEWISSKLDQPMPEIVGRPSRRFNVRVSNQRFREEFNYELQYPTYREGYQEMLQSRG